MYLRRDLIVRLACMKHAASVRPEPGSNSPLSEKLCPSLIHLWIRCSTFFCCPWNYSGPHLTIFRFRQLRCLPLIRFARTCEFRSLRSLHSSENFIIRFWINKFFNIVLTILCLLFCCQCAVGSRRILIFLPQDSLRLLRLLFIISISVCFRLHSCDYLLSSLSPLDFCRPEVSSPNLSILSLQLPLSTSLFTFRYMTKLDLKSPLSLMLYFGSSVSSGFLLRYLSVKFFFFTPLSGRIIHVTTSGFKNQVEILKPLIAYLIQFEPNTVKRHARGMPFYLLE